jgi:hypothetical protein
MDIRPGRRTDGAGTGRRGKLGEAKFYELAVRHGPVGAWGRAGRAWHIRWFALVWKEFERIQSDALAISIRQTPPFWLV